MKRYLYVAMAGLLLLAGCESRSPLGGPGATNPNNENTRVRTPENTFRLTAPAMETNIKQGESKTITIGITRGTDFDQDVKLEFSDPPKGMKIKADDSTLKAGAKEMHVKIDAAADAALGDHTVTVTGTPNKQGAATT